MALDYDATDSHGNQYVSFQQKAFSQWHRCKFSVFDYDANNTVTEFLADC